MDLIKKVIEMLEVALQSPQRTLCLETAALAAVTELSLRINLHVLDGSAVTVPNDGSGTDRKRL